MLTSLHPCPPSLSVLLFPTAQIYTEDCRWAPVDTLPAHRQPAVPAGRGKGQQDNSEMQLIFQSSLQDQGEVTLGLSSYLCLVSSVSLSFPTHSLTTHSWEHFPNKSLAHKPSFQDLLLGTQPKTLPEKVFVRVVVGL